MKLHETTRSKKNVDLSVQLLNCWYSLYEWGFKVKNGSRDPNDAPFMDGLPPFAGT